MEIEVFKTNVNNAEYASFLIRIMKHVFAEYEVNFDLDDCDRILRVQSRSGMVNYNAVIQLMKDFHVDAEVLSDELTDALSEVDPGRIFISALTKSTDPTN